MHNGGRSLIDTNRWAWSRLVEKIKKRDGYRCKLCGRFGGRLEVDHVIPRALGGSDRMTNLRTLCRPCHVARTIGDTDRTPPRPRSYGHRSGAGNLFAVRDEPRSDVTRGDYTRKRREPWR